MDSLTASLALFLKSTSTEQLIIMASAFVVWFIGGYLLKAKLRKRLSFEQIELDENILFEHINKNEWLTFSALALSSVALLLIGFNLQAIICCLTNTHF